MEIFEEITDFCNKNLTLYGFADISNYRDNIISQDLKKYNFAISMGIKIDDEIVNNLDNENGRIDYMNAYTDTNNKLNEYASCIEKLINDSGFEAKSVNASYILPDNRLVGDISHKLVANLAGLGWIGKSCLLITPEYGPRIRWATILTNMKLPIQNRRLKSMCDNCTLCVDICPPKAFKNVEFDENQPRETRYDANLCKEYFDKLENEGKPRLCGLCVKVCPYGLKK